ncbi:two-component sensor histidine kinase [Acrocarpospora corrugata]|uniref:histidine kinase n=1 Tax=Acrocarpospora corrugata TaxID=35763 RepID=A0A5M3VVX2_9ACTN|nr:HAMP domain-containing sensor histidine kinase [Acrocarpospora corrugata]GES00967.1 two-component sensor histidine kinase [Acrocarpospora corrugata]
MIRRRLIVVTTASVAAALLLLTAGLWIVLSRGLDHDADLVLRSRAEAAMTTLELIPLGLAVEDPPLDQMIDDNAWVFDGAGRVLAQPRAPADVARAAASLRGSARPAGRDVGGVRLLAVPAPQGGSVVVGVSLRPYRDSGRIGLLAALVLDVMVLGLTVALTRHVVRAALRPVTAMTRQALEWSEHDLDHRFSWGPARDELTGLAANLDVLLNRVAVNLRHERLLSAEIAHELRTPLARLRAEAEIALLRPRPAPQLREALEGVVTHAGELTEVVDTLLAFSRTTPGSSGCRVADALNGIEDDVALTYDCAPGLRVSCAADLLARILAPLLGNARAYGSRGALAVGVEGTTATFTITDAAPGVLAGEEEVIFEPARRGSAAHLAPGSGLGLALSRRLARAAGGDVTAVTSPCGGRFQVRLPLA